jgi:hypothetical protein
MKKPKCEVRKKLAAEHKACVRALTSAALALDSGKDEAAKKILHDHLEAVRRKSKAARDAYEKHVAEHGCDGKLSKT